MINFYIPHQKEDEKIIMLLRRHPIILFAKIAFWAVVALMPLLLYIVLGDVLRPIFLNRLVYPAIILFTTIYYLYVWLFMLYTFVDYYLDVWIVTNHRILNIEQKGLFHRITSEQKLHRIQDITAETRGFFETMLNFGAVHIQTAGEQARFEFKQIKNPEACANKVTRLIEETRKFQSVMKGEDKITTSTNKKS